MVVTGHQTKTLILASVLEVARLHWIILMMVSRLAVIGIVTGNGAQLCEVNYRRILGFEGVRLMLCQNMKDESMKQVVYACHVTHKIHHTRTIIRSR